METIEEQQQSLKSLVRQAANGWISHTDTDERVLADIQYDTVMWCVCYLWKKGHGPAGASLLALVPKERAERALESG